LEGIDVRRARRGTVGRVMSLAGSVVFADDPPSAIVEEILTAAASITRPDQIAEPVILIAPCAKTRRRRRRRSHEVLRRVRLDVEHHAPEAVVAHPADDRIAPGSNACDDLWLPRGEIDRPDAAL